MKQIILTIGLLTLVGLTFLTGPGGVTVNHAFAMGGHGGAGGGPSGGNGGGGGMDSSGGFGDHMATPDQDHDALHQGHFQENHQGDGTGWEDHMDGDHGQLDNSGEHRSDPHQGEGQAH